MTAVTSDTPASTSTPIPSHVPGELVVDFDYINDPVLATNPQAAYLRLRSGPDLVYTPRNGGHWIATRRDIVAEIFQNWETFGTFPYVIPKSYSGPKPAPFTEINGPDAMKYRRLLNPLLAPKSVTRFEEQAHELMVDLVDEVQAKGECDFAVDIAQKLPIFIIMRWLDLPFEDRFMLMKNVDNALSHPDPAVRKSSREFTIAYVDGVVAKRQKEPGDDLLSVLVNGEIDGRKVTHDEGVGMARNLVHGGLDTVRNMMSYTAWFLAENDEHRRQLVEDPSLIPAAVEELLRWYAIPNMSRCVAKDTVFRGVQLKEGDQILLPLILSGLDERVFVDPMQVNFKREGGRHVSFGSGLHICPGQHLARIEMRVFLEQWLKKIPNFRLTPGTTPSTRGGIILAVRSLPLQWDVTKH